MPVPLMTTFGDDKMGAASVATGQPQLNRGSFELKFANDLSAHIRYAWRAIPSSTELRTGTAADFPLEAATRL